MSNDKVLAFLKANLGIASLLSLAMQEEGATKEEADSKMWLVDSKGLLVKVTLPHPHPISRNYKEWIPHYTDTEVYCFTWKVCDFLAQNVSCKLLSISCETCRIAGKASCISCKL